MLFNSVEFALFLPLVFLFYWVVCKRSFRLQNILLIAASFVFYGWWDWRFLFLLLFTSLTDFFSAILIGRSSGQARRKMFLSVSIVANLGVLGFFKYYNFFAGNFIRAFTFFGHSPDPFTLKIILPVGVSFYTFQALSYTIDVYRKKTEPERNLLTYLAFISFFPQLVAGPIERAGNMLPQFNRERKFNYEKAVDGLRQILWGLSKKIIIADSCAGFVKTIFSDYESLSGSTLFVGAVLFAFQIYADFSGYSDIAIGTARLFGFDLMRNFAYPYFSKNIIEFWKRWHISLTSWFRDYLYIPLGGNRVSSLKNKRNVVIVFLLSGLWHGANWTFIAWGGLHSLFLLVTQRFSKSNVNKDIYSPEKNTSSLADIPGMLSTFFLVVIAWIFFRAESLGKAFFFIKKIFSPGFFTMPSVLPLQILSFILLMVLAEWMQRTKPHPLQWDDVGIPRAVRQLVYYTLTFGILYFAYERQHSAEFIYFQF